MAKRTVVLRIGLPHSGGHLLDAALAQHAEPLAAAGVGLPARSEEEMFRAAVEVRRDHKAWGLRRRDVEGVWSGVCRRVHKGPGVVVLGHDLLAGASADEVALLLDGLAGTKVHLVVTVGRPDARVTAFPDDHDLGRVLARWATGLRADRVHVLPSDDLPAAWTALTDLLGVDAATVPLDLDTLAAAPRRDPGVLRLIAESTGALADPEELAVLVDDWAKATAEAGYDVRGDLASLAPVVVDDEPVPGPAAREALLAEALGDVLAETVRLRREVSRLEEEHARVSRKRSTLARRLSELAG